MVALALSAVLSQRRLGTLRRAHARRLVETAETERAWVAREVHDDAIQRLVMISHEIRGLEAAEDADRQSRLHGILGEVADLSESLRQLAHRLHPTLLEHVGLGPALGQLSKEFDVGHGLKASVTIDGDATPSPRQSLALYRVAQEGLQNVARHAAASCVSIGLRYTRESIMLSIRDDGIGFDPRARREGGELGLVGIRERILELGGEVSITSHPGEGTTIVVRIPRNEPAE